MLALMAIFTAVGAGSAQSVPVLNERISIGTGGVAPGIPASCDGPVISPGGRFVAFHTAAFNFLTPPRDGFNAAYVRDLVTGRLDLVTVDLDGKAASGTVSGMSADGRIVVFTSSDSGLVPGTPGGASQVYVRDRLLGVTELVSTGPGGVAADRDCGEPAVSADGRIVTFSSVANNLVAGDTNNRIDIFVHDRLTEVTERVSVSSVGAQGNNHSRSSGLSADGRFVTFLSSANNLVAGDTNGTQDAFLRDRSSGVTERVSLGAGAVQPSSATNRVRISPDGQVVVFQTSSSNLVPGDTNGVTDVFARERASGAVDRVSVRSDGAQTEQGGSLTGVSGDGRFVLFQTQDALVPEDTNFFMDLYLRDRLMAVTQLATVTSTGVVQDGFTTSGDISADARFVTFATDAANLVPGLMSRQVYVRDMASGVTSWVSQSADGSQPLRTVQSEVLDVSADGRFVCFRSGALNLVPGDTNLAEDVFVRDRLAGQTERVSVSDAGGQLAQGAIEAVMSADGRYVAFTTLASDVVPGDTNGTFDVFVRDRASGTTRPVTVATDGSFANAGGALGAISADGRYIAFVSVSHNLPAGSLNPAAQGAFHIWVRDQATGALEAVDVSSQGQFGNASAALVRISADGSKLAFATEASNLAPGDENGVTDVFVRDRNAGVTTRISASTDGTPFNLGSDLPDISPDGRFVTFRSRGMIGAPVPETRWQLMLHDLTDGSTEVASVTTDGNPLIHLGFSSVSMDGRWVAFESISTNVVPGDTNLKIDLFVRDRRESVTTRASLSSTGAQLTGHSTKPRLTPNGRFLAFSSEAAFVTPDDPDANGDVFLRELRPLPAAPGGLQAVASSSNSVDLTWSDNSQNEDAFIVERKSGSTSFAPIGAVGANVRAFQDSTALPDTNYVYRVSAENSSGTAPSNEAPAVTPPLAPGTPTGFSATAASQTQVRLTWNPLPGTASFHLERQSAMGAFEPLVSLAGDVTTYLDERLTAATRYTYRLRARNAGGDSAQAETAATTPPNPPAAPSDLTLRVISQAQIDLAWEDQSGNEDGFQLERRSGGSFEPLRTLGPNVSSYQDQELAANRSYTYRIRAFNVGGASAYSNLATGSTPPNVPGVPGGLTARTVSQGRIDLAWTDTSDDESGFKIERMPEGGEWTEIHRAASDSTTYRDAGLPPNTRFSYRVRAVNPGGDSAFSNEASASTLPEPPGAPSGLRAEVISHTLVVLTWNDGADNESAFEIERATGGEPFALLARNDPNTAESRDQSVAPGTRYRYRLRAVNAGGASAYTPEVEAVTPPSPPPAPTGLTADVIGSGAVRLVWVPAPGATEHWVERRSGAETFSLIATLGGDVSAFEDTGLVAGTEYVYRLRAANAGGAGPHSAEVSATTAPEPIPPVTPPSAPEGLGATARGAGAVRLTWQDRSDNEEGFRIERRNGSGDFVEIHTSGASTTTFDDSGLAEGESYTYRVRAFNSGGASGYSNRARATAGASRSNDGEFRLEGLELGVGAVQGGRSVNATLVFSGRAPRGRRRARPVTIELSSSNPDVARLPRRVRVPPGERRVRVAVTTFAVEELATLVLKATQSGTPARVREATLSVRP